MEEEKNFDHSLIKCSNFLNIYNKVIWEIITMSLCPYFTLKSFFISLKCWLSIKEKKDSWQRVNFFHNIATIFSWKDIYCIMFNKNKSKINTPFQFRFITNLKKIRIQSKTHFTTKLQEKKSFQLCLSPILFFEKKLLNSPWVLFTNYIYIYVSKSCFLNVFFSIF